MKRSAALLVVLAALGVCGQAQAVTLTAGSVHDPATVWALNVARGYWHASPGCPQGIDVTASSNVPDGVRPAAAAATLWPCGIWLNEGVWWPRFAGNSASHTWREAYCQALVHEWGHLLLGPDAFAATNPTDPAHSPDPRSIMYYDPIVLPAGCRPMILARAGTRRSRFAFAHE